MKTARALLTVTLASALYTSTALATTPQGCYKPVRGYAASICSDLQCTTQSGYYRIVMRNPNLPLFKRRLVLRGSFSGRITGFTDACPGGNTLSHVLRDSNLGGTVITDGDIGCPIDPTDTTPPIAVVETLNIVGGSGAYANLAWGRVTLTGQLAGLNTFAVAPTADDIVCFDDTTP
ncbi:MAG: hypothetical protein QNJ91_11140 [Gammaproteobacteria bacterium]|nr:hypothetical protein [Gammaproteobacteria bacterium]